MSRKRVPKAVPSESENGSKPLPPNIFLYIQLAHVARLPDTVHQLEIHMQQGDSLIIKCVEQYNTSGIIIQNEFYTKPTYTLIFQQDNLDRINYAADNPLFIQLYMRKYEVPLLYEDEDMYGEDSAEGTLRRILQQVEDPTESTTDVNDVSEREELILLSVGYLDVIKLFGHHRSMIREELFLYPVPGIPAELRVTVHTEWHLYTLVPIAKEIGFTNMVFVTFESIYNLKDEYALDVPNLSAQLSFRSVMPINRTDYHMIPWCTFGHFEQCIISSQDRNHFFEYFREKMPKETYTGLKSPMDVQLHRLFKQLMPFDQMEINFDNINSQMDNALVCNSFHRYILTNDMSNILFHAFAYRRYIIFVEVFQTIISEKKVGKQTVQLTSKLKLFEGLLDPAIMLFPGVQSIRFAVELKYKGVSKNAKKLLKGHPPPSARPSIDESEMATFAIIKLCLLVPLGQTYNELKVFRESFINQNRLLYCNLLHAEYKPRKLSDVQSEGYARFDLFMRETIRYIVEKNVNSIEEKRGHFCCALQNLTNIMLKIVGTDFNIRQPTTNNVEFANLCALAFNELEDRARDILRTIQDEGFDELVTDVHEKNEMIIDYVNGAKVMNAVGDKNMERYFSETDKTNSQDRIFEFYDLIDKMERGNYVEARKFFKTKRIMPPVHEYLVGWIKIYLDYVDTRDDPDPTVSCNATECLLNSITQYAERYEYQVDGWILLNCYYKFFKYAPGSAYARWRLEHKIKESKSTSTNAPLSLWGIMLNIYPVFDSQRTYIIYETFKLFVRLGLYEFGELVFHDIESQCSDIERYLINTQLKLLLNKLDDTFQLIEFDTTHSEGEEPSSETGYGAFCAQVNGNVEYYRGNFERAAYYYAQNATQSFPSVLSSSRDNYMISKLRLAYLSYNMGNYQQTISALNNQQGGKLLTLAMNYLMGKAYYRLDDLAKAQECFINCSTFGAHVPDIWGYLALVNLQMGNNLNAITCWKYSRIDPLKTIGDESIFNELEMLDLDNIELYVDVPSPPGSCTVSTLDDE